MIKNLIIWSAIAIALIAVMNFFNSSSSVAQNPYSTFVSQVKNNEVSSVVFNNSVLTVTESDGQKYTTIMPIYDGNILPQLLSHKIEVSGTPAKQSSLLTQILISWFPMILLIGIWIFFMRQMQGGGGKAMSFGKSKAKMIPADEIKTRLTDVAGCDEAKEEVAEIVDFLKNPKKYQNLGGKIPKGILMAGPPGTGKTLLARAIAGEAGVPFFLISGSDFVEMFVGVGASRVRDLFAEAKKNAPSIIFIDEIDAVGRQRGSGIGGGHDEREQTLNQMLAEMDGFKGKEGVIVIAATNRVDVLDGALIRPGRFDRQVHVGLPDVLGRDKILQIHMKNVPTDADVDTMILARGTPGYSGADLANLVNEATLFAARNSRSLVSMNEFEMAKDKINMGPERKTLIMTEKTKESTSYHEAGHAIVGYLMPEHDPVHKVTIVPRGRALGVTFFLPEGDQVSVSQKQLEGRISTAYAGRLAEELIYGIENVSTGASNDIQYATNMALKMVTEWGFSKSLGPIFYNKEEADNYLNRTQGTAKVSETTSRIIEEEVYDIINRNFNRAKQVLEENIDILHSMKDALMKYETIEREQIIELMERREVTSPKGWRN
ncbi:MAG: ATP-dependent zinc metalloprotease FtsH [Psittacicella sp.]